jgi:hypothetical protein
MTYKDFKSGLYIKYHLTYLKSTPFIKFVYHSDTSAKYENPIILMTDAEVVLNEIKYGNDNRRPNPNMARALCLMAQGYCQWEVAEEMGLSDRTIEQYIHRAKKYLY